MGSPPFAQRLNHCTDMSAINYATSFDHRRSRPHQPTGRATIHRVGRREKLWLPSGRVTTTIATQAGPRPQPAPPPLGRPARLHRWVNWWGGPVKGSGTMIRERPGPQSTTDAGASSVPPPDPAGCLPAGPAGGGTAARTTPTARDDTCRPVTAGRHRVANSRQRAAAKWTTPDSATRIGDIRTGSMPCVCLQEQSP
jgi:hypothetical protein